MLHYFTGPIDARLARDINLIDPISPLCRVIIQVESQRADPLPSTVASRASILMRHLSNLDSELYNNEFLHSLSRIRCVPVHLPPPVHRLEDDGIYVTDGAKAGSEESKRAGTDKSWSGGVALVQFKEAAVPKDANLVFTAFPVQMEGLVPPQVTFKFRWLR